MDIITMMNDTLAYVLQACSECRHSTSLIFLQNGLGLYHCSYCWNDEIKNNAWSIGKGKPKGIQWIICRDEKNE